LDAQAGAGRRRAPAADRARGVAGDVAVGPVVHERRVLEVLRSGADGQVTDSGGDDVASPRVFDRDHHVEVLHEVAHPRRLGQAADATDLDVDRDGSGNVLRVVYILRGQDRLVENKRQGRVTHREDGIVG